MPSLRSPKDGSFQAMLASKPLHLTRFPSEKLLRQREPGDCCRSFGGILKSESSTRRKCIPGSETRKGHGELERNYDERANLLTLVNVDPAFDALRSDPRFNSLIKRMGLTPHADEKGLLDSSARQQ
jgi:hypothetical protein